MTVLDIKRLSLAFGWILQGIETVTQAQGIPLVLHPYPQLQGLLVL